MLIVACRLMTSGVKGVSLLGSRVFKFCNKPKGDTIRLIMIWTAPRQHANAKTDQHDQLRTCSRRPLFLLILFACTAGITAQVGPGGQSQIKSGVRCDQLTNTRCQCRVVQHDFPETWAKRAQSRSVGSSVPPCGGRCAIRTVFTG